MTSKNSKTILMLGTYPIKRSIHGGQRRTRAVYEAFKRSGFTVIYVAIFHPAGYGVDERGQFDLPAPKATLDRIKVSPVLEDVVLGESIYEDPIVKKHVQTIIQKYNPMYLDFEQPYTYFGMRSVLNEMSEKPKLIFSSHNIEHKMKAQIYADSDQISHEDAAKVVAKIENIEKELSRSSSLLIAVSRADLEEHKNMGAERTLLVPNGINVGVVKQECVDRWNKFFAKNGIGEPVLFTGSAHPPNWTGFLKMVGTRLGFMPLSSKLMIVGDIGNALEYVVQRDDNTYSMAFWARAYNCKRLSDDDLTALIHLSKVIILPITEGGGSNLKTAEAIYAKKHVIATDYAMRGYEEFAKYPNVHVVHKPEEFKKAMAKALSDDIPNLSNEEVEQTHSVLWPARMKPLEEIMRNREL